MPLALLYHDVVDPGRFDDLRASPSPDAARYKLEVDAFESAPPGDRRRVPEGVGVAPILTFDDGGSSALSHRRDAGASRLARAFLHHHRPDRHAGLRDRRPDPGPARPGTYASARIRAATRGGCRPGAARSCCGNGG